MRIQLSYANAYLVRQLLAAGAVADVGNNGMDLIELELHSGEPVTVHMIERDIDVAFIAEMLADDAQRHRASMFILWGVMLLPDPGMLYQPYDWMQALLALYGDKIYGFDVYGQNVAIFPVYFDHQPGTPDYLIRNGDHVDVSRIGAHTIYVSTLVKGTWRIVDFEEGKRPEPADKHSDKQAESDHDARFNRMQADRNPVWMYYELLGVDINDDAEAVRRAYHNLAMKYHPDLNPAPEATERMQQINMAYQYIMNLFGED